MKNHLIDKIFNQFLSDEYLLQKENYDQNGFTLLENRFSKKEISVLNRWVDEVSQLNLEEQVFEKNSDKLRTINGPHLNHQGLLKLCCLPRLLLPAMNLLGSQVYVHQFKINFKKDFEGDVWEWHQDYIFWKKEDHMPKPTVMNVVIFFDDITEFNAPLFLVPGSHKLGTYDVDAQENPNLPGDAPAWMSNSTVKFKYGAPQELVKQVVSKNGIFSAKGKAGTVLFFDGNLFHASGVNLSPYDRKVILITYNRVDNALEPNRIPRPEFIANSDSTPLNPSDDKLF